ncbi:MAG TPA: transglutaminase domain-containing protein [Candidatus Limnocylindrales bacterium]
MTTRRVPLAPTEGWVTLGLVTLMCVVLALAVDDAQWVLGRTEYLDMLVWTALGGVLTGFIGAKVGWGRWLTYLIGALFAALLVPILTGLVMYPHGAPIHDLFVATADSVVQAWIDLAIRNLSATPQYLHYTYTLGLVVWATSMFASYAVFGHHRPLNAVIVVGVVLLGNMAFTSNQQLPYLIVFSVASLFLLIRSHVFDEQSEWTRRRIGDPASISSVYLRGGTIFIAVAVLASAVLTQTAASAPLAGAWDGVEEGLLSVSRSISRYLPTGGSSRPVGLTFGSNMQVGQVWQTSTDVAMNITRNPSDKTRYYWRAVAYDRIDAKGWGISDTATIERDPGAGMFAGLADDVDAASRQTVTFTISPEKYRGPTVVSPQTPVGIGVDTKLQTIGTGRFAILDRDDGRSDPYTVTASVPVLGNGAGQVNESALRQTSTTYPEDIKALYLEVPGPLGPNTQKLETKILELASSDAPIDVANAAVKELQSSNYRYAVDIRDIRCEQLSTVECFATFKRGFCQYYAATMAVILRDLGIPTRIAEGFLPGTMDGSNTTERIQFNNAHAWVEVYFPGYGWVSFDPTSPDVAQLAPIPSGPPAASATPRPSVSSGPRATIEPRDEETDGPSGAVPGSTRTNLGPLVVVGLLLLIVVAVVAFLAWRRGPRGPVSADGAYGTVTRIASRFGFGPRPAETVYEYATSLGGVLPDIKPELQTVARAKVESTYARQVMGDDRLAALRSAQRRLRVSLLRLAFRRKERRRRR